MAVFATLLVSINLFLFFRNTVDQFWILEEMCLWQERVGLNILKERKKLSFTAGKVARI